MSMTPKWRHYRAIVFDKDGTLVDLNARWAPLFESIVAQLANEFDRPNDEVAELVGFRNGELVPNGAAAVMTMADFVAHVAAGLDPRDRVAGEAVVRDAMRSARPGPVALLGPVHAIFEQLQAHTIRIGLATNDNRSGTMRELDEVRITGALDAVCCADDGGPIKPDGDVLAQLCRRWEIAPGEMLFVGDSENDRLTACNAGCDFVWVDEWLGWWDDALLGSNHDE